MTRELHTDTPRGPRAPMPHADCPVCELDFAVNRHGRMHRHGAAANPCPGSGQPAGRTTP